MTLVGKNETTIPYLINDFLEICENLTFMLVACQAGQSYVDREIADLLHYIELAQASDGEKLYYLQKLRQVRQQRREIMDCMSVLKMLEPVRSALEEAHKKTIPETMKEVIRGCAA